MVQTKKLRVMVLYGGRSGEHEISLISAASVIRNLDLKRYDVLPVSIDKQGRWLMNDLKLIEQNSRSLPVFKDAPEVVLPPHPGSVENGLLQIEGVSRVLNSARGEGIDVVFPVMHGPLCEDGTIQGLLELADLPYVGCGVLASAVCMDKEVAKRLARDAGLPIVPYVSLKHETWKQNPDFFSVKIANELGYPVFVKPANLGSSVGVHKVKVGGDLRAAIEDAFRYDHKILVEQAIQAREIEFAVLEDNDPGVVPRVSIPGEIVPTYEFYSYEAKYLDENGAELVIPAHLTDAQVAAGQKIAQHAFELLECEGMARVDLFLDKNTGSFFFNEVNTIPGFTSISMYPKLWEYSGISYPELLTRLIDLSISRHRRKRVLVRNYDKT